MIIDVIFTAVKAVLTPVFNALPTFSLTSTLGLPTGIGKTIGDYLYHLDNLLPLHESLNMVEVAFAAILGFYATYKFANWLWRHIPDLWGFGPGSG